MDKKELQKRLNKPYTTDNWKEVVQFVFPNVQILNPAMVIPIDNDKVEIFRQIGNVRLHDGKNLALFELKLKANVNIIRNRVELNNLVSKYIDQDQNHGVLSIFEQGTDDYRFTFSARASEFDEEGGDFVTTKTDTKRFTYVLGKNESCKTPAQRFYDLSEHKDSADIKAIEDAFSVEKLSKLFFKEYKDQYNAFVNYMMQTPGIFKAIYSEDDKAIRDFVKILLGRIIFIKFVQKKGWMGVDAASKKWIDGDYRFLENGFAHFKHQDLFYSTFLEPLFDALDEPNRPNDIFNVSNTRIPYLSGGLFELEDKKTKNINFPAKYFNDLFEFLDRYNFTIDENDTNDHEVGIDPEMLGHIFENLLEDNKDKGAFYTPKEIVRYMCQESLKEYLKTSLENNKQWPTDATEAIAFEQNLHNFVTKKEAGGIIEFEETIARALKDVKICDPAIGSGAFPMGLLNEIFQLVHKLHDANKDKVERVWELKGWQPNLVKQNIIQNSIYGVDIEKGAVDVARLRFWLSLIVDEPEPKALPHLEYKIVVGNSLVSKLDETIIDIDWNLDDTQHGLFGSELAQQRAAILQDISDKQQAVFDPNSDEEKLSLEIRNLKIDLLCKQLELMINNQNIPKEPKIIDYQNRPKAKFVQDQAKYFETVGWKQQITKLKKLKKQPEVPLHFFDWKLDFPEIMNEQVTDKVGFDIVIGNPPYIKVQSIQKDFTKYFKTKFKSANGKYDIYVIFIEHSFMLLKKSGVMTFINPHRFLVTEYGKGLRDFIFEKKALKKLVYFGVEQIFETATTYTGLFLFKLDSQKFEFTLPKTKELSNLKYEEKDYSSLTFNYLVENNDDPVITKIIKHKKVSDIFDGVYQGLIPMGDDIQVLQGNIKGDLFYGYSKAIEKEITIEANILKPLLKGENIKRYLQPKTDLYIFFPHFSNDKGKTMPYSEIDLKTKFPLAYNYILNFKNDLISKKIKYKTNPNYWYSLHRSREQYIFENSKLITPQLQNHASFTYDDDSFYADAGGYIILHKQNDIIPLKSYLAIFNSKVFYYFIKKTSTPYNNNYFYFKTNYIEPFCIPIKLNSNKVIFENLVVKILKQKTEGKDTIALEQQIDNLVYKLYELTYDEVLMVEPEYSERMSMEEYEGLKVE